VGSATRSRPTNASCAGCSADLTKNDHLLRVGHETRDLDIGLLISNAGAGHFGSFLDNDFGAEMRAIDLNVRAPAALAHVFGKRLVARGHGGMMILSSMVGLLGVRNFANYAATKAFDLTLAEGLAAEWKGTVDVHAVLPGFTESEYMSTMDMSAIPMPLEKTPNMVRGALSQLGGRHVMVIPGMLNNFMATMMMYMPRWFNTWMMGMMVARLKIREGQQAPA
jgi:short-subunit dehydrogenase